MAARVIPLVLGLAVLAPPRVVHAQAQQGCNPLDTSTFTKFKEGGCLRGGIATDAAGVSTPHVNNAPKDPTLFTMAGKPLTVQIPATATIRKAYLTIIAKHWGGFNAADPAAQVKLNGVLLTSAGPLIDQNADIAAVPTANPPQPAIAMGAGYRVYDVTTGFGINGPGQYSYEERNDADFRVKETGDKGMAGAQLVVVFDDPQHTPVRYVSYRPQFLVSAQTTPLPIIKFDVTNLPKCGGAPSSAVISLGVSFECASEQLGKVSIKPGNATTPQVFRFVGGRDDGAPSVVSPAGNCSEADYNSMLTVGSFGYNNAGALVGVAGDDPNADLGGGPGQNPSPNASNSRASDELYRLTTLDQSGILNVQYEGDGNEFLTGATIALDMNDADCDTIVDTADNCPVNPNTDQADSDGDGFGNACDTSTACGNGQRENGEGCDDANAMSGDGCNAMCLIEDTLPCNAPGNTGSTGNASCASGVCDTSGGAPGVCKAAIACGNGMLEAGEGCDDGNVTPGDNCNAMCLIENTFPCNAMTPGNTGNTSCASGVCDTTGGGTGICEPANSCGNGVREAGEGCDDGNTATGDNCNAMCLIENGNACNVTAPGNTDDASCASGICDTTGGAPGTCEPANSCGNGVLEMGEGCDDGATAAGDGCNGSCLIENTLPCNAMTPGNTGNTSCASGVCDTSGGTPGVCKAANVCGNGVREAGEGCDDGNATPGDNCNAMCLIEDTFPCNAMTPGSTGNASCASGVCDMTGGGAGVCEPANTCGNGVREAGEGCDDGNMATGDNCNAMCLIENGNACNANAPGNTGNTSCASGVCDMTGGGAGVCEPANACGNGVREAGEGCDDGNMAAGDKCNAMCLIENGNACNAMMPGNTGNTSCASGRCDTSGGMPGICTTNAASCGNGMLDSGEGCDDGNVMPGDKCNASCLIEDGRECNATAPGATGNASCASGVCNATAGTPGVCNPANTCGNGVLEAGEGCDDGAGVADDGCNASCLIEDGGECNTDESCASGVCNADGTCNAGVGISGGGCNTGSGGAGGNAALLLFLGLWVGSVLLRRGRGHAGGR